MKTLTCPQCGGNLNLTQYAGVYHCRYCRTLVESDVQALRELEIRERELALTEQILSDTKADIQKRAEKVRKWHKLCLIWWIFIAVTFLTGVIIALFPSSVSLPLANLLFKSMLARIPGSPAVASLRPDHAYPPDAPPSCSKSALLFLFWAADMFLWGFIMIALSS